MILSLSNSVSGTFFSISYVAPLLDDSEQLPKLCDLCRWSKRCSHQSRPEFVNIRCFVRLSWSKEENLSCMLKCHGYHLLWVPPTWIEMSTAYIYNQTKYFNFSVNLAVGLCVNGLFYTIHEYFMSLFTIFRSEGLFSVFRNWSQNRHGLESVHPKGGGAMPCSSGRYTGSNSKSTKIDRRLGERVIFVSTIAFGRICYDVGGPEFEDGSDSSGGSCLVVYLSWISFQYVHDGGWTIGKVYTIQSFKINFASSSNIVNSKWIVKGVGATNLWWEAWKETHGSLFRNSVQVGCLLTNCYALEGTDGLLLALR